MGAVTTVVVDVGEGVETVVGVAVTEGEDVIETRGVELGVILTGAAAVPQPASVSARTAPPRARKAEPNETKIPPLDERTAKSYAR